MGEALPGLPGAERAGAVLITTLPRGRWLETAQELYESLLSVVFPADCVACGSAVERPSRGPLCADCWEGVARHRGAVCECGLPLGRPGPCGRCRRGLQPLRRGCSLGPYEGVLRTLVHELKFRGRRRVAERLAERLLLQPEVVTLLEPGCLLVPVPLHPRRLLERGYNQAELLARALARRLRLRCAPRCLVRRRDTPSQTGLSAGRRRENVRGAFAVRERGRVAGCTVVLVDDVVTTGATVGACARQLLEAGAREVRVVSLARIA